MVKEKNIVLNYFVGMTLLFPLFFQLSSGIYTDFLQDSGGNIAQLPFPIAVVSCLIGILLLRKNFRQANVAMLFVAAMCFAMMLSVIFASSNLQIDRRKLIQLAQFIMPTFAVILGQMIVDDELAIPSAFLAVLILVVPLQLVASWLHGSLTLTHDLYAFSIYQHFQYVPLVLVCAFGFATTSLWNKHRKLLTVFFPIMFVYAIASVSFLTIAAFVFFLAAFSYQRIKDSKATNKLLVLVIISFGLIGTIGGIGAYYAKAKSNTSIVGDGGQYIGKFDTLAQGKLPTNAVERFADWKMFGSGIVESPRTFVFGHISPMAREVRSSAHNWYIDFAYSFGLISLLPILLLIAYTFYIFRSRRDTLGERWYWLAAIVFYLVVIDSNFKVTLRQPYSGLFTYFLWGLLLSQLRNRPLSTMKR